MIDESSIGGASRRNAQTQLLTRIKHGCVNSTVTTVSPPILPGVCGCPSKQTRKPPPTGCTIDVAFRASSSLRLRRDANRAKHQTAATESWHSFLSWTGSGGSNCRSQDPPGSYTPPFWVRAKSSLSKSDARSEETALIQQVHERPRSVACRALH